MISYQANELSDKERYKLLTGSVVPRPIAWITSLSSTGVINAAPFSYFNIVSSAPALLAVSINRKNGHSKDTAVNILASQEAVIQIVSQDVVQAMNATAASAKPDVSEIELAQIDTLPSDMLKLKTPMIANAKIQLETTLSQHLPIQSADRIVTDLLILEVKKFHFSETVFDQAHHYILADQLDPVSRLAGNNYGLLGKQFTLARPK